MARRSKMEVQLAPETSAILQADNITIRFFYRLKFRLDSRSSGPVIAWAQSRADAAIGALLKHIGRKKAIGVTAKIQMLLVELLRRRKYALLLFDLSLLQKEEEDGNGDGAKPAPRLQRPIHEIHERGGAYAVYRSKRLDARVATAFTLRQGFDKGPLPYFVDFMNPPIYDEGIRLDGPLLTYESPEEDQDESEEGVTSEQAKKSEGKKDLEDHHDSEAEPELKGMDTPTKNEETRYEQTRDKLEVKQLN